MSDDLGGHSNTLLPVSLLTRLNEEAAEGFTSLVVADLSTATTCMRHYASKKLLSLTPKALSQLDHLLTNTDPKAQAFAIGRILDHSPATKPLDPRLEAGLAELPESAITALVAGLSAFGIALGIGLRAPSASPDIVVTTVKEEIPQGVPHEEVHHTSL